MAKVVKKGLTEAEAQVELEKGMARAEKILNDTSKIERLLERINWKKIGEDFSKLTVMVEITKAYIKKEYTKIPVKSIVAIVGAIIYFANPFDVIPDVLPIIGQVDDLSVVLLCWKMISHDIDDYLAWKETKKEPNPV